MERRKMIIIGSSNNYNELGLVRSFGVCGIKPYGIIICKKKSWKHDWLHMSKYWAECHRVENAEDALKLMEMKYGDDTNKAVVTTPVDYVMQMIDDDYERLSTMFILQSINGQEGLINFYANKLEQSKLTYRLGFKTLPTKIIQFIDGEEYDTLKEEYPVLLKPVAGGEGSKDDITICRDENQMEAALLKFRTVGYTRILCQPYLEHRTEILAYGACNKEKNLYSYTVLRNIRQWPLSYGVGSYGELINDHRVIDFVDEFYKAIMNFGYDGPIDTDIFLDNNTGEFFISEYNWRPGGRNFTSLGTNVYSIVLWYFAKCGELSDKYIVKNQQVGFSMNDGTDINHVIQGNISFKQWCKDFKKANSHALWYKKDMIPAMFVYLSILKNIVMQKLFKR